MCAEEQFAELDGLTHRTNALALTEPLLYGVSSDMQFVSRIYGMRSNREEDRDWRHDLYKTVICSDTGVN